MCELIALCCFSKRTGCLVVAALHVIGAVLWLTLGAYVLIGMKVDHDSMCRQGFWFAVLFGNCYRLERINFICTCMLVFSAVQLTCASLMIHGVRTNNRYFMVPFLIMRLIFAIVGFILIIIYAVVSRSFGNIGTAFIDILVEGFVISTLNSYYNELKRGKADDALTLTENCQNDDHQDGAPTIEASERCSQGSGTPASLA